MPFKGTYECETSEIHEAIYGDLHKMKFIVSNGILRLKGSLHIFHNKGIHNADDFTFRKLANSLRILEDELGVRLSKATVHSAEIGVNVGFSIRDSSLFERLGFHYPKGGVLNEFYCKQPDVDLYCLKDTRRAIQLKLYNKSKQYELENESLRVEICFKKRRALSSLGLNSLSDLRNRKILSELGNELYSQWGSVVLLHLPEEYTHNTLALRQSLSSFWVKEKSNKHYNTFRNKLIAYRKSFGSSAEGIKTDIGRALLSKFNYLLSS